MMARMHGRRVHGDRADPVSAMPWKCPSCGRSFGRRDQWHSCAPVPSLQIWLSTRTGPVREVVEAVRPRGDAATTGAGGRRPDAQAGGATTQAWTTARPVTKPARTSALSVP
jgi:hypothetical protein